MALSLEDEQWHLKAANILLKRNLLRDGMSELDRMLTEADMQEQNDV